MENLASVAHKKKIPIIEIFGPVIQGEGAMIGKWTSFIRTGGCDFRCSACDSMHAVDPNEIKKNAKYMDADDILNLYKTNEELFISDWVTLSGGNPVMWDLSEVVSGLKERGFKIAVETQGSVFKNWLNMCDLITVSPKFSGMQERSTIDSIKEFMTECAKAGCTNNINIKVPVFNGDDLEKAQDILLDDILTHFPLYLSLGNPHPPEIDKESMDRDALAIELLKLYREVAEAIKEYPILVEQAIFLPQLHVLAYGNERCK